MELNPELAQYIVDYTSQIVDCVINIMNPNAIIIASTNPDRIGELHIGAQKVLSTGKPYIIKKTAANSFPNIVPGISLPIHFQKQIIGVVGIGAGKQSETIGRIIQSNTELLIEQTYLKEVVNAEEQVLNEFLTHLLTEPWQENESYFNHQLALHKFNYDEQYLVISAEIFDYLLPDSFRDSYTSEIVHYEKNVSRLIQNIKQQLQYPDIIIVHLPNLLVFLVPYTLDEKISYEMFLEKFILKLGTALFQIFHTNYRIGIGGIAANMSFIHTEYRHAVSTIKISKIITPAEPVTSFSSIRFEYQILNTSSKQQEKYYSKILHMLTPDINLENIWIKTLDTFFQNNQSISKTANALYIHRNTLLFRLNRIGKLTGLHPQNFRDAVALYTALTFWKLRDFEKEIDRIEEDS